MSKKNGFLKASKGIEKGWSCASRLAPFTSEDRMATVSQIQPLSRKNIGGHKRFIQQVQPRLYQTHEWSAAAYPNPAIAKKKVAELAAIQPLGPVTLG